mmetsp:Transcript_12158/g.28364  ORF Transcript_12158/g.28364 Transcript_12158/m.28364 type:complete len:375 (+) Transcript_12158:113-1237(+)
MLTNSAKPKLPPLDIQKPDEEGRQLKPSAASRHPPQPPPDEERQVEEEDLTEAMERISAFFAQEDSVTKVHRALRDARGKLNKVTDAFSCSCSSSPLVQSTEGLSVARVAESDWNAGDSLMKSLTSDRTSLGTAEEPPPAPRAFQAPQPKRSFVSQLRFGVPVSDDARREADRGDKAAHSCEEGSREETPSLHEEDDLQYLVVPESARTRFQEYAKALAARMSIECADRNPFIQALQEHREELQRTSSLALEQDNQVPSLPSRLATRSEGMATLHEDAPQEPAVGSSRVGVNDVFAQCRLQCGGHGRAAGTRLSRLSPVSTPRNREATAAAASACNSSRSTTVDTERSAFSGRSDLNNQAASDLRGQRLGASDA